MIGDGGAGRNEAIIIGLLPLGVKFPLQHSGEHMKCVTPFLTACGSVLNDRMVPFDGVPLLALPVPDTPGSMEA